MAREPVEQSGFPAAEFQDKETWSRENAVKQTFYHARRIAYRMERGLQVVWSGKKGRP